MHVDKTTFHRFDRFNLKYNPCGQSRLREIFIKQDNLIHGRFLAELTREVRLGERDCFFVGAFRRSVARPLARAAAPFASLRPSPSHLRPLTPLPTATSNETNHSKTTQYNTKPSKFIISKSQNLKI